MCKNKESIKDLVIIGELPQRKTKMSRDLLTTHEFMMWVFLTKTSSGPRLHISQPLLSPCVDVQQVHVVINPRWCQATSM